MHTRFVLCVALALILTGAACQREGLSELDRAAIVTTMEGNMQAGRTGDWPAFFSYMTDDAVIMWPNRPAVEGLDAIREVNWVRAVDWAIKPIDVIGAGDLAYVRGTYSLLLDMEGATRDEGKFLNILRRQPDGSWRFSVWMNNSDLPLPESDPGT